MSKKLLQVEHLSIALKKSISGFGEGHQFFVGGSGCSYPFRPIRKRKNDDLPGNFGAA